MTNKITIYNDSDLYVLDYSLISTLKNKAIQSKEKRYRFCLHHSNEHLTQEMIIVFHIDTILIPHRHPIGRSESYHIIEGTMNQYFFDDNANVVKAIRLGEKEDNKKFYYRLSSHTWHLPVPTSEFVVYHETITGPFINDDDIEYPTWKEKFNSREKINELLDNKKITYIDNEFKK